MLGSSQVCDVPKLTQQYEGRSECVYSYLGEGTVVPEGSPCGKQLRDDNEACPS